MPYTVPKLTDFSPSALDSAVRELLSALDQESAAVASENDWKVFRDRWMARKNGILSQVNDLWLKASPKDAKREVGRRVNEIRLDVEDRVQKAEDIQLQLSTGVPLRPSASTSRSPASAAPWARNIPSSRR